MKWAGPGRRHVGGAASLPSPRPPPDPSRPDAQMVTIGAAIRTIQMKVVSSGFACGDTVVRRPHHVQTAGGSGRELAVSPPRTHAEPRG
jgi:hypothetical protein